MIQKKALITGITGQDGSYLAEFLLEKGYEVWGLVRRTSLDPLLRLNGIKSRLKLRYGNLLDSYSIYKILEESRPDEIYNLAAQSDVAISFECPHETREVNYHGVGRLIHTIQDLRLNSKVYQASTSEMFGNYPGEIVNEQTPFNPQSPYAEAKVKAHLDYITNYRERYGMFLCSGFLFNHESPKRGKHFVTRKITHSMVKIKLGLQDSFSLGNLNARRDWGFAGDYVKAMWMILQQKTPRDYVIATGESHTVRDFVTKTAEALGMQINWEGEGLKEVGLVDGKPIVLVNEKFFRPKDVHKLCGDSSKARAELGWQPSVKLGELVKIMVAADLKKLEANSKT